MKSICIGETLAKKYPQININDHIWHELVAATIEYGTGWHDLVIELVKKIESIYEKNNVDISEFRIDQIKEKYGELRFYTSSSISEVHDIILEYENRSATICDECGDIGSLYEKNGWLQTLCEKCASETGYEKTV